jgi:predicted CoA-substrate-specific enzyme activase
MWSTNSFQLKKCWKGSKKCQKTKKVNTILFAGIDIGSTTTKCVILDANQEILCFQIIFTTFDRNQSGNEVLEQALAKCNQTRADIGYIVATGYGRKAFERADKAIPEIICHAMGTVQIFPGVRTIIDIGGQDSKVIEIDPNGVVARFEMNDKCAAGTGRFFEVLAHRLLNVELEELEVMIAKAQHPCTISSMCTIFAESEIISLLSQGVAKEDIVAGMSKSIVRRIVGMGKAGQIRFLEPICFSGGVAKNHGVAQNFAELLGKKVTALELPQSTAALGAALAARKEYLKSGGGEEVV